MGTQATLNVIMGERYKVIPEEVKQYVRGFYGRPPAPINPNSSRRPSGRRSPSPAARRVLDPGWEKAKAEIGALARSDEDDLLLRPLPAGGPPLPGADLQGSRQEEIAAAVAAKLLIQQQNKAKQAVARRPPPPSPTWKMAGRALMRRGW